MLINKSKLFITVITNVLFISLFISLFFFTYTAYIEQEIVQKQMGFLSETITGNIKLLGPDIKKEFKEFINKLPEIQLVEEDNKVKKMNAETMYNAIVINIIFAIVLCILVLYVWSIGYIDWNKVEEILITNVIIVAFIALTEFGFLTYFGANFVSLNPNTIVYNIINNIKDIITN